MPYSDQTEYPRGILYVDAADLPFAVPLPAEILEDDARAKISSIFCSNAMATETVRCLITDFAGNTLCKVVLGPGQSFEVSRGFQSIDGIDVAVTTVGVQVPAAGEVNITIFYFDD